MGTVRQLKPRPSAHYDPAEDWARPPQRQPVVLLRSQLPMQRDYRFATYVLCLAVGYVIGWWTWS